MSKKSLGHKGVSLYYQVETHIRSQIESGIWEPGYKLPTETQLCQYFNVSRTTIRQAVDSLVDGGFLVKKQGSGTYVTLPTFSRNRLSTQPSDSVCRHIYAPIIKDDLRYSYQNMIHTHTAHVLMLHKQNLISDDDIEKLIQFFLPLYDMHPEVIGTNPLNEDMYLNFEQYCIKNLGIELAGKLSIARSRNDMVPTVVRMNVRTQLIMNIKKLISLIEQLQTFAKNNHHRYMGGYTHSMISQPITLEFYFLALADALERDLNRLILSYDTVNLSPLGACGLAGTSFPIDRTYTAKLLGFDGLIINALDAVASRDFLLEVSSSYATLGSTISRFAQDLYLWSTDEFGYVSFADAFCCASSLMPQKKNALSLEHIKSKTSHLSSAYIDILFNLKGTSYSHCRDLLECVSPFYQASEQLSGILELLIDTLANTTFNYERMEQRLLNSHSIATDIADYLVLKENISFRSAHNIVATALREQTNSSTRQLTLKQLNRSSKHYLGKELSLTEQDINALYSLQHSLESKACEGSPNDSSCEQMQITLSRKLKEHVRKIHQIEYSLNQAHDFFHNQVEFYQ